MTMPHLDEHQSITTSITTIKSNIDTTTAPESPPLPPPHPVQDSNQNTSEWTTAFAHLPSSLHSLLSADSLSGLTSLVLSDRYVRDEGCEALCTLMRYSGAGNRLLTLDLRGNDMHYRAAVALSSWLQDSATVLKTLILEWNHMGDEDGCELLCAALHSNHSVTHMDLRNNQIFREGGVALGRLLSVNRTLTHLDVRWNDIGLAGGKAISEALIYNTTIISAETTGNNIPHEISTAIEEALRKNQQYQTYQPHTHNHNHTHAHSDNNPNNNNNHHNNNNTLQSELYAATDTILHLEHDLDTQKQQLQLAAAQLSSIDQYKQQQQARENEWLQEKKQLLTKQQEQQQAFILLQDRYDRLELLHSKLTAEMQVCKEEKKQGVYEQQRELQQKQAVIDQTQAELLRVQQDLCRQTMTYEAEKKEMQINVSKQQQIDRDSDQEMIRRLTNDLERIRRDSQCEITSLTNQLQQANQLVQTVQQHTQIQQEEYTHKILAAEARMLKMETDVRNEYQTMIHKLEGQIRSLQEAHVDWQQQQVIEREKQTVYREEQSALLYTTQQQLLTQQNKNEYWQQQHHQLKQQLHTCQQHQQQEQQQQQQRMIVMVQQHTQEIERVERQYQHMCIQAEQAQQRVKELQQQQQTQYTLLQSAMSTIQIGVEQVEKVKSQQEVQTRIIAQYSETERSIEKQQQEQQQQSQHRESVSQKEETVVQESVEKPREAKKKKKKRRQPDTVLVEEEPATQQPDTKTAAVLTEIPAKNSSRSLPAAVVTDMEEEIDVSADDAEAAVPQQSQKPVRTTVSRLAADAEVEIDFDLE